MSYLTDKLANLILESNIQINGLALSDWIMRRYKNSKKIYHWFAQSLLSEDNLIGAQEILESGVKNNPNSIDFVEPLTTILLNVGDYKRAIEYLLVSLKITDPDKADKAWLANTYSLLAKANLYIDNLDIIEEYIAKSRDLASWDLDACNALVEFYLKTGEKEKIIPFLKGFIKDFPSLYPPYVWLADYYNFYLRDFDSAAFWYTLSLSKARDKATREYCNRYFSVSNLVAGCVTNFSYLYLNIGKTENSLSLINEYAHYPYKDEVVANEILLDYYIYLKDYNTANTLISQLLKRNPKIHEYWAYLAKVQALSGKFEESENSLNKAFALNQYSFLITHIASEIYIIKGDWRSAEDALQKLIKKYPFELDYQERMKECLVHLREE